MAIPWLQRFRKGRVAHGRRRNYQKYYETEEWALSALKQRRNILQLCERRLTPEQITKIEGEIYPHRA